MVVVVNELSARYTMRHEPSISLCCHLATDRDITPTQYLVEYLAQPADQASNGGSSERVISKVHNAARAIHFTVLPSSD